MRSWTTTVLKAGSYLAASRWPASFKMNGTRWSTLLANSAPRG
jgi:hypothetical protein